MKNLYFFIAVSFMSFSVFGQIVTIPDLNFKAKLIANGVDINNDGEIQQSEALLVNYLALNNSGISSLEGLQNFTNLNNLECSNNPFTEINLNALNSLQYLKFENTLLTTIDCSQTSVTQLFCSNNSYLTNINVKNNLSLNSDPDLLFFAFKFESLPLLSSICLDTSDVYDLNFTNFNSSGNVIIYTGENCDIIVPFNPQAITNFEFDTYFNLFPNPSKNSLNIEAKQAIVVQSISIYNTLGQLVQTATSKQEFDKSITIDVSQLKTGTYFVTIHSDKGKTVEKFIKL